MRSRVKYLSEDHEYALRLRLVSDRTVGSGLIELIYWTGCRVTEALSMRSTSFRRAEAGWVCEVRGIKGSNDRVVPIPDPLGELLKGQLLGGGRTLGEVVFPAVRAGSQRVLADRRFAEMQAAVFGSVVYSLHSLRHSWALRFLKETGDLLKVRIAMGHKNIQSTIQYLNFMNETEVMDIYRNLMQTKMLSWTRTDGVVREESRGTRQVINTMEKTFDIARMVKAG